MTIKFIGHIKKWFDKKNGNSYFSARIFPLNNLLIGTHLEFQYGYGTHPRFEVMEVVQNMPSMENIPKEDIRSFIHFIEEDCLKRDVVAWGKAE